MKHLNKLAVFIVGAMLLAGCDSPDSEECNELADDYRHQDKLAAQTSFAGISDNSAPRENLRKLDELANVQRKAVLIEVMKDKKCSLPISVKEDYILESALCSVASMKAKTAFLKAKTAFLKAKTAFLKAKRHRVSNPDKEIPVTDYVHPPECDIKNWKGRLSKSKRFE